MVKVGGIYKLTFTRLPRPLCKTCSRYISTANCEECKGSAFTFDPRDHSERIVRVLDGQGLIEEGYSVPKNILEKDTHVQFFVAIDRPGVSRQHVWMDFVDTVMSKLNFVKCETCCPKCSEWIEHTEMTDYLCVRCRYG